MIPVLITSYHSSFILQQAGGEVSDVNCTMSPCNPIPISYPSTVSDPLPLERRALVEFNSSMDHGKY